MYWAGLLLATAMGVVCLERPVVHLEQGAVRGTNLLSVGGRVFAAFQGIPYAQPPIGDYRFKEPVPAEPWVGVWEGSQPGSDCLQYDHISDLTKERIHGDEDCLYLNVYTPQLPTRSSQLLNVIVFFHGGAFMFGAGDWYGPHLLLDRDVLLVTINYRLGILGFLSTQDEVVPGNNGLKDQVLALKWVQRNIAAFGGNPNSVTLTGSSAGAASVHYHYISPLSKGLFHRGMSSSGTALCPWAETEDLRLKADRLGSALGCNTETSVELVKCLKNRPARQIVQQTELFQEWLYNPFSPFGPTVEVAGSNPFLSKQPIDAIMDGSAQDVPWLTSVTTAEGLYPASEFVANATLLKELDQHFERIAPHLLDYNYTVDQGEQLEVSRKIRQFYLGDKAINNETTHEIIQMVGDRLFVVSAEAAAKLHAAIYKSPIYFYVFSYRGKYSLSDEYSHTNIDFGSSHGDDTGYVLDTDYVRSQETEQDREMVQLSLDIWTSFADTGNPTPAGRNVTWLPVTSKTGGFQFLHIASSAELKMESSSDLGNSKFWNTLPFKEPTVTTIKLGEELDHF